MKTNQPSADVGSVDTQISVDAETRTAIIHELKVSATDSPSYVQYLAGTDATSYVSATRAMLEVGARVIAQNAVTMDAAFLSSRTEAMAVNLELAVSSFLSRVLDPNQAESATRRIRDQFTEQAVTIKEMIKAGTANITAVEAKLAELGSAVSTAVREAVGSTTGGVGGMIENLQLQVSALRDQIVQQHVRTTIVSFDKGKAFEERIEEMLYQWARAVQNLAGVQIEIQDLRAVSGPMGKTGDYLVKLMGSVNKSIILELKDQAKLTAPAIIQTLGDAMVNRSANAGIFVVASQESLPKELGSFTCFGVDKWVVSETHLEVAIKLAVMYLLFSGDEETRGIDAAKAGAIAEEICNTARRFTTLLTAIRSTIRSGENSLAVASEIKTAIAEKVDNLLAYLKQGESETKPEETSLAA